MCNPLFQPLLCLLLFFGIPSFFVVPAIARARNIPLVVGFAINGAWLSVAGLILLNMIEGCIK